MEAPTKTYRAAYMRRRAARERLALLQARQQAGLDLATGMARDEVVMIAQLRLFHQNALFAAVNVTSIPEIDAAFKYATERAIGVLDEDGHTQRFHDEVNDLFTDAFEAWKQWQVNTALSDESRVDGDD